MTTNPAHSDQQVKPQENEVMNEEIVIKRIMPITREQRIAAINVDLPQGQFYMERDMTLAQALELYPNKTDVA